MNGNAPVKTFPPAMVQGMRTLTRPQYFFLKRANENPLFSDDDIWNALKDGSWESIDPSAYPDLPPQREDTIPY